MPRPGRTARKVLGLERRLRAERVDAGHIRIYTLAAPIAMRDAFVWPRHCGTAPQALNERRSSAFLVCVCERGWHVDIVFLSH